MRLMEFYNKLNKSRGILIRYFKHSIVCFISYENKIGFTISRSKNFENNISNASNIQKSFLKRRFKRPIFVWQGMQIIPSKSKSRSINMSSLGIHNLLKLVYPFDLSKYVDSTLTKYFKARIKQYSQCFLCPKEELYKMAIPCTKQDACKITVTKKCNHDQDKNIESMQ
jgi:hypothetical protein